MKRYWMITPYNSEEPEIFDKAWEYDLKNGTIAVGWTEMGNLSGLSREEIDKKYLGLYEKDAPINRYAIQRFYHEISEGDIVIARRGRKKIIGVGEVTATAFYDEDKGRQRLGYGVSRIYPNFLGVKWQEKIINFNKQVFAMFTLYEINEDKYSSFIQGKVVDTIEIRDNTNPFIKKDDASLESALERPEWLEGLINDIESLKNDSEHKERAHESLVEAFYELLGFKNFNDIKYRQGRIDISVKIEDRIVIVNEVKPYWTLSYKDKDVVKQAYNYSFESGARFVVVTNGDYYAIFDKDKGRSYESNFVGDFKLSRLRQEDLKLIEFLKRDNIIHSLE